MVQRLKYAAAWAVLYTAAAVTLGFLGFLLYAFIQSIAEMASTPEGVLTFQIIGAGVLIYGVWRLITWASDTVNKERK